MSLQYITNERLNNRSDERPWSGNRGNRVQDRTGAETGK